MKKIILLFILVLGFTTTTFAQMSDEQVVAYAQKENAAGKDQKTIAKELLARGVTKEQMFRIRDKYLAAQQGNATSNASTTVDADRSRKANGEAANTVMMDDLAKTAKSNIFGHDVFRNKELTFEPNMNISTPVTYVLGPGDEVIVDIYGASQSTQTLKVSPDGNITVPKIGLIHVSGLTIGKAQAAIRAKMGAHYQGSTIKATIGQTRSVVVNILGEVNAPGTYTLSAFASVFNALYMAGGVTDIGTVRNIKVSRNGKIISRVDVYDYIINGKLTGNVMLHDNDVIIVSPYDAVVDIKGKIKRPMLYEMKKGETLKSLVAYAGGFKGDAYTKNIRVERKDADGFTVKTVEEWDFTNFKMEDGDIVFVDSISHRYKNMLTISGAVFHPGTYSLNSECNTVRALIKQSGGLTEDANTNRGVISRENPDRTRKTISLDIAAIMSGKAPDVTLEPNDFLTISSNWRKLYGDKFYVYGAVDHGGEFEYADDVTLEDAITMAGGLLKNASLNNIEVTRMLVYAGEKDSTYQRKAKTYLFKLKDGLLIEGQTGFRIMPNDVVSIRVAPEYDGIESVSIGGEVLYPGTYSLTGIERISDLVKRAGGLKLTASATAAEFSRELTQTERLRKEQLIDMADARIDSLNLKKLQIKNRYNLGIDLVQALKKPGSDADIILRGGDQLIIPKFNNTVKISGEVLYPNVVAYEKGHGNSYYLNQAGGIGTKGHKKNAFIIYADGQVSKLSKGKAKPGCEIVVPSMPKKEKMSTQTASLLISGSGVLATVAAVLITVLK